MSCNAVICGSVLLEETLHLSHYWPHHHFTFCHNDIVHSLQLCSVEMHSFAHFDTCVAFDGVSEIKFLMFY